MNLLGFACLQTGTDWLFHTIFSRMFSTENSVIIQERVSLFRAKVVLNTVLKIYIVSPTKAEGRHDYCPLQSLNSLSSRDTLLHHNPLCGFYVPQIKVMCSPHITMQELGLSEHKFADSLGIAVHKNCHSFLTQGTHVSYQIHRTMAG